MSSDASPPSGIRLEAEPPWPKVIATTLRLWLRRRVLHVPDDREVSGLRLAVAGVAVVIVAAAAGTAVVALGGTRGVAARPPARQPARQPARPPSPAEVQAGVNAQSAAAWIAANVSHQTVVGCDPVTCADLAAAGFRSNSQVAGQAVLSQQDVNQAVGLPGSMTLVVATPALRAKYSTQVAASAPVIIATFGTGASSVQVRQFVPGGAAAYQNEAGSALAGRRKAGRSLAADGRVFVYGSARLALTSGLVDPRLIAALRAIASRYAVHVTRFGASAPAAGGSAPLRMAEIGRFATRYHSSDLTAILKLVRSQPALDRPQLTIVKLPDGVTLLKLEVLAPTPL